KSGHTKSCGCLRRKPPKNKIHGRSRIPRDRTYKTWKEMRNRCNNPNAHNWKWYGGRGIKVCVRWDDFLSFVEDMGERPEGTTIEKRDNKRYYAPSNCRWATQKEQTRKQAHCKHNGKVASLRNDRDTGMSYSQLARKYKVSKTSAARCATGITWAK